MKINFNPHYQVFQDKVVKCNMECIISDCEELVYVNEFRGYPINIEALPDRKIVQSFSVTAIAKCDPKDTFDIETGRRIAESRATIKALNIIDGLIDNTRQDLNNIKDKLRSYSIKTNLILNKENKHLELLIND